MVAVADPDPPGFPFAALPRAPGASARRAVVHATRALLAWQRTLGRFPPARAGLPRAAPFVSLYVAGRLRGCMGSDEGGAGFAKLARAFLAALHDPRGAALHASERGELVARVSYAVAPLRVNLERARAALEPGTHGVALVAPGAPAAVLMPFVARESGYDARAMLASLARKARVEGELTDAHGALYLFEAADIAVGAAPEDAATSAAAATALAARWLAAQVDRDGAVCFAVDPRTGARSGRGEAYHARAAVLIGALAQHGGHAGAVRRARAALGDELGAALAGTRAIASWSAHPAHAAGALALAHRAGIEVRPALRDLAQAHSGAIAASPWHAAQAVGALGRDAPAALWSACVADLEARPWAPWTVIAARALGDAATLERGARALTSSLRAEGPHRGGAGVTAVPEVALTAAAIEALAPLTAPEARAAVRRGREFLRRWQLVPARLAPWMLRAAALGAFPASPVRDVLRCDITGHALAALL